MEREALRTSGRTLYMSLLLPDRRPTVTDHTHVHFEGTTIARGGSDYYIRILSAYGPTVMVVFESRALRDADVSRLKEAKLNFGTDIVHRAMVETWAYPPYGDYTMFSLSTKANHSLHEVYQALWRFFENKGYVPTVNVALDAAQNAPTSFKDKLAALPNVAQKGLRAVLQGESCELCRPYQGPISQRDEPEDSGLKQVSKAHKQGKRKASSRLHHYHLGMLTKQLQTSRPRLEGGKFALL